MGAVLFFVWLSLVVGLAVFLGESVVVALIR